MKLEDYPLGEIPYEAMSKAMRYKKYDLYNAEYIVALRKDFTPTNMDYDLCSGKIAELIYWYPKYIDQLYDLATKGEPWRRYLMCFHPENIVHFEYFFREIVRKLDKIQKIELKTNHLGEIQIEKGKAKL